MTCKSWNAGFTLVELIMIIIILGILSATAYVKMPTGMKEEAAARELKRAVRHAQHLAMTREYTNAAEAWGLTISASQYTVQRAGMPDTAVADYKSRYLLDNSSITLTGPTPIRFNGLGEPIDADGNLMSADDDRIFTITLGSTIHLTFCPETGYVQKGTACP